MFFTINFFFYPSRSLSLSLSHSLSLYRSLYRSLSKLFAVMAINQFQTFLFFYCFLRNQTEFLTRFFSFFVFYDFRFDFLIKIIAIELISPSRSSFSNSPFSNFGRFFFSLSLSFLQFLKIYDFMVENNWNFFMSSTVEFVTLCLCFDCDFLMVLLTIFFFF